MKKFLCALHFIIITYFAFAISACAWTDVAITSANFPDTAFREYIRENFDTASDDILSDSEINEVTRLLSGSTTITRFNGIEYFTALTSLQPPRNIIHLNLSSNTNLSRLDFDSYNYTYRKTINVMSAGLL